MRTFLLYLGPALSFFGMYPYIRDVIKGKTKPNTVSWVTWTVLTGIGTAAVMAEEGFLAGLLPLSATLCTGTVVLLGLKYGFAKYSKFDIFCQVMAVLGLVLWLIFNSPLIALIAVVAIDIIAVLPTLVHAWHKPHEETWQTFALGSLSALITLVALTNWSFTKILYPFYLAFANGLLAVFIILRRRNSKNTNSDATHTVLHENI